MKKIASFILMLCAVLTFAACADQGSTLPENTTAESTATESTTPEITLQEVYDAGKTLTA